MIEFNQHEWQYLQQYINEMYQSSTLRDGPGGSIIISIRNKFLVLQSVDLTSSEVNFLLLSLQNTFQSSHSILIPSQLGSSMRVLGEKESRVKSLISQSPEMSGTYLTQWDIIQSCMTKLGLAPLPPYKPLVMGPDGDEGGIAIETHHDINDGTMNNYR